MKKIVLFILIFSFIGFTGCGKKLPPKPPEQISSLTVTFLKF